MSCRSTNAGSAFTTFARLADGDGLSDVATLSAFHQLRREYQDRQQRGWLANSLEQATSEDSYRYSLTNIREHITRSPHLTDARRASILARIDAALADTNVPDRATIYALNGIRSTVSNQGRARLDFLRSYASTLDITMDAAQARWNELEDSIDRRRGATTPTSITDDIRTQASRNGLSNEDGSLHAFALMQEEARQALRNRLSEIPRRVVRERIAAPATSPDNENLRVLEYGLDPRNGYLEIVVEDISTGQVTEHAYQNWNYSFPPNSSPEEITNFWFHNIRSRRWMEFQNNEDRLRAAAAPRCALCGQFSDTRHTCPDAVTNGVPVTRLAIGRYTGGANHVNTSYQNVTVPVGVDENGNPIADDVRVTLPVVTALRPAAATGSVLIEGISDYIYLRNPGSHVSNSGQISGDMAIVRNADGSTEYHTRGLQCNCREFVAAGRCAHLDAYAAAVRARLNPPARIPAAQLTPEQRQERQAETQRRAEAAAASDWTRSEATLAEARRTWQEESEVSYSENSQAFLQDLQNAQNAMQAKNGLPAIPYMEENVLGGMATRESGQAFGMEIEYEFPPTMTREEIARAQRQIGQELFEAGLSGSAQQAGYGASKQRGFRDTHLNSDGTSNWSWERDGSVNGGELVTPGMFDEPETWQRLKKATEILRSHGAVPTVRAGAHVHVGTSMYNGDALKYAELAKLMTQHEDVMFRLAQEPVRGSHRQGRYASPLPKPPSGGWRDMSHIKQWQGGRGRVLNFGGVNPNAPATDHPEFRIFDSTLDPAVMQSQIKLAVAMTHAAARIADGVPTVRNKEQLGAHLERRKNKRRAMNTEEIIADAATFRSFMDTLFTRAEDKAQLTALFAATKWVKPDSGNRSMQRNGTI